jgi:Integrase core domain
MDMQNITKITLAWELHEQGVMQKDIAAQVAVNRDTLRVWFGEIEQYGLLPFLDLYTKAKKGPRKGRQIDPVVKRYVWEIREREMDCCGEKIQYYLERDRQIHLAASTIYEILAEKYVLRSKWKKNQARGAVPHAIQPREVVQMDTIDFGELFAFTGIDIFTREADILIAPALTADFGYQFLKRSMDRRFGGHVHLLQTDGGPEFKEAFKSHVREYCDRHRVARPYKKNEQAYIESFNRTVRKECLGWTKYRMRDRMRCISLAETFLDRYHYDRPHMGKGMQPLLTRG